MTQLCLKFGTDLCSYVVLYREHCIIVEFSFVCNKYQGLGSRMYAHLSQLIERCCNCRVLYLISIPNQANVEFRNVIQFFLANGNALFNIFNEIKYVLWDSVINYTNV